MKNSTVIATPFGNLSLSFSKLKLSRITLCIDHTPLASTNEPHSLQAATELAQYFKNPRHTLTTDYFLEGTPFQLKVWKALCAIPSGSTLTYGMLAKQLGTSPRAIGQACKTNPLPIIIPCHRIVGANNAGGYAGKREGKMLEMKLWLLKHEATIATPHGTDIS